MTFQIDGKRLQTVDGVIAEFAYSIKEVALVNEVFVVLLDVPANKSMTENVFGVSRKGEILWQIERIPETGTDPSNSYTGLFARLKVFNWNGVGVEIDANTGKVITKWFGK